MCKPSSTSEIWKRKKIDVFNYNMEAYQVDKKKQLVRNQNGFCLPSERMQHNRNKSAASTRIGASRWQMFIFTSLSPFRNGRLDDIADRITARDDGTIHFFDFLLLRFFFFLAKRKAGREGEGRRRCCHLVRFFRMLRLFCFFVFFF